MKLLQFVLFYLAPRWISAANEADVITVENSTSGEAIFAVQQDGKLFVPYGQYPHAKGLQYFNKEAADLMAGVFNSMGSKIGRLFNRAGVPVYRGHPDVPGRADSNPAAPAVGWIEGITAENDGAYFDVKWNEDGQKAVSSAQFRFYSPHWDCRKVKGGIQPVRLKSMGLTNNPRIPVPAIANDDNSDDMKLTELLRKLLGIPAENDAPSETDLDTAATALQTRIDTLTSTANDAQTALTKRNGEYEALQGQLTDAQSKLTAANDRATTLQAARVDRELEILMAGGRVIEADRPTLRTELLSLENDAFTTRVEELGKGEAKIKTGTAKTAGLGAAKSKVVAAENDNARSLQRQEVIAEERVAIENDKTLEGLSATEKYNKAFNRAAAKHPQLFPATPATTA